MASTTRFSHFLPEEIIFKILLLLPVSSLVRLRSVCKLWLSIISNLQFVETHLANSQKKQASVLTHYEWPRNKPVDYAVYIQTRDESVRRNLPPQFKIRGYPRFVSSCNGLVCLASKNGEIIYLWNPSTNHFKIIPTPKTRINWFAPGLRFCFDPVSNDYKLLRFKFSHDHYVVPKAEVYSANADSWKEIQIPRRLHNIWFISKSSCSRVINGVLLLESLHDELIISFDFGNEVFKEIGVLSSPQSEKNLSTLLDFEGSVALVRQSIDDKSVCSLWTLEDICGQPSWNKKFNFEINSEIDRILFYLGEGKFVTQRNVVGYSFYDYLKKETHKFYFQTRVPDKVSVVNYTPSLVSLKGFEQLKSSDK